MANDIHNIFALNMPDIIEQQPSEIYLYGGIYEWSAQDINMQLEALMGEAATIRVNTPGGSVFAGWSIGSKMVEHGDVTLAIDGTAMSMGFLLPVFAKRSYAYDTTLFLTHKAFTWYTPDETDKAILDKCNKDLKAKLKMKIDSKVFKEVTGYSFEQVFDGEDNIDLILTAQQAKQIGLIDEVRKLKPADIKAMTNVWKIAAQAMATIRPEESPKPADTENPKNKPIALDKQTKQPFNMTIEEIREKHPAVFAQIVALGVAAEKDRTGAWLAFLEIDSKAVAAGIESGSPISQTAMAKFTASSLMNATTKALNQKSPGAINTTVNEDEGKTEIERSNANALKEVDKLLGLKTPVAPAVPVTDAKEGAAV